MKGEIGVGLGWVLLVPLVLRRVPALGAAPHPQLCSPQAGISFWAHCPCIPGCFSGSDPAGERAQEGLPVWVLGTH